MSSFFSNLASFYEESGSFVRVCIILLLLICTHRIVNLIRRLSDRMISSKIGTSISKSRTVSTLVSSVVVFLLYFGAVGLVLAEFGVSLAAYLASASIMGLAIGFGSQGLVQDVVTGLTILLSDLFDVGDMVEIAGQTGVVRSVGIRFTVLENSFGASVFIPNRTIGSVVNYPRGYVRMLFDVGLSRDEQIALKMVDTVRPIVEAAFDQFPGILITPPSIEGQIRTSSGRQFLRVKYRIWPGRGGPLETGLKQEIVQAMRRLDSEYADWMVAVSYEVEKKSSTLRLLRRRPGR